MITPLPIRAVGRVNARGFRFQPNYSVWDEKNRPRHEAGAMSVEQGLEYRMA